MCEQVQESNNLCVSGLARDTLSYVCEKYSEIPQLILANKQYVQCCMEGLGNNIFSYSI